MRKVTTYSITIQIRPEIHEDGRGTVGIEYNRTGPTPFHSTTLHFTAAGVQEIDARYPKADGPLDALAEYVLERAVHQGAVPDTINGPKK